MASETSAQLHAIFDPKSVAVMGASSIMHKWGAQTLQRLVSGGYAGRIYPINPNENEIQGLQSYGSVLDVPDEVDLAVITLRAEQVPAIMWECVEKGVKGAIIISADFAETGKRGRALQEEITDIAREGGLRFVGPNCFGVCNAGTRLNTLPFVPPQGGIGFISQSGSLIHWVARAAQARGIGFSKLISVGNQADLDAADFLAYLAADPETEAIVMYLEGFRDGRKLLDIARETAGRKPVVVYKTGRNPGSARVSMSHTAAMIGLDEIFEAVCRQAGFIRAYNLFGSVDMAAVLLRQPLPRGSRIGIQGTGGQCMILADTLMSLGMEVPELHDEDVSYVVSGLSWPAHAPTPKNPVDHAGSHTAFMDATVINRLAQLDYIDGVISNIPVTFHLPSGASAAEQEKIDQETGQLLAAVPLEYKKPVILLGPTDPNALDVFRISPPVSQAMESGGIICYQTPEEAATAMATLVRYAEIKKRFNEDY